MTQPHLCAKAADRGGRKYDEDLVEVPDRLVARHNEGRTPAPIGVLSPPDLASTPFQRRFYSLAELYAITPRLRKYLAKPAPVP